MSRLFHAVVGVGISLGLSNVGCQVGSTEIPTDPTDSATPVQVEADAGPKPDASSDWQDTGAKMDADASVKDSGKDATLDAKSLDAAKDVSPDAFCDATWPTTKGSPQLDLNCIDPGGICRGDGGSSSSTSYPSPCALKISEYGCEEYQKQVATFCVNGVWQCTGGMVLSKECKCFGTYPGYECTKDGLKPIADAGADASKD